MEYVYGFTEDNEKVVIGTIEEAAAGYSVTFPSAANMTVDGRVFLSINEGEGHSLSNYAGQTIEGVETLRILSNTDTYSQTAATADVNFEYSGNDGSSMIAGVSSSFSHSYSRAGTYVLITLLEDTIFSYMRFSLGGF